MLRWPPLLGDGQGGGQSASHLPRLPLSTRTWHLPPLDCLVFSRELGLCALRLPIALARGFIIIIALVETRFNLSSRQTVPGELNNGNSHLRADLVLESNGDSTGPVAGPWIDAMRENSRILLPPRRVFGRILIRDGYEFPIRF